MTPTKRTSPRKPMHKSAANEERGWAMGNMTGAEANLVK